MLSDWHDGGAKGSLRAALIERRRALSPAQRAEESKAIHGRIRAATGWRTAETVVAYASTPDEVDTWPLLEAALQAGKRLVLPRVDGRELRWHAVRTGAQGAELVQGVFGIREPGRGCPGWTPGAAEDVLWLLPGVGFDRSGHRLGRGGGYYDRALSALNVRRGTVGLAFRCQLLEAVPARDTDWTINAVVTADEWVTTFE